jgi:hypothetical protein
VCRAAHAACAADALSLGTKGDLRQGLSSTLPPIHPCDVLVSMTACGRLMSHPRVYDCSADLFVFLSLSQQRVSLILAKGLTRP